MMRKHILVVDDDSALRSRLRVRLESTRHTVDTAENGWDGLTKFEHADYDVVLWLLTRHVIESAPSAGAYLTAQFPLVRLSQ